MDSKTMDCPSCGQLTAQMKEDSSISHRQYDQLLQKLMELERQGDMELYAGLSAGGRHRKREPGHPAVGPVWNLLLTEKRLKEASTWMW